MILTNRLFVRKKPLREAKSIFIFCEGAKREYQYFNYFREIDSRINIEIYKLHPHEDNSPLGLLTIAKQCIVASPDNPKPKYSFQENDEVWIILDIDRDQANSRAPQISHVLEECNQTPEWSLAQSNPCFEVWLHYHFSPTKPVIEGIDICSNWKRFLNDTIIGGFDSRRHPIYIEDAIQNAENTFVSHNGHPDVGCTEVYNLSKSIFSLIKNKINNAKNEL